MYLKLCRGYVLANTYIFMPICASILMFAPSMPWYWRLLGFVDALLVIFLVIEDSKE